MLLHKLCTCHCIMKEMASSITRIARLSEVNLCHYLLTVPWTYQWLLRTLFHKNASLYKLRHFFLLEASSALYLYMSWKDICPCLLGLWYMATIFYFVVWEQWVGEIFINPHGSGNGDDGQVSWFIDQLIFEGCQLWSKSACCYHLGLCHWPCLWCCDVLS